MKFTLKIEGPVLSLVVADVPDTEKARGRLCRIELDLLHLYGSHASEPVAPDPQRPGKLLYHFHRGNSDHELYREALGLLKHNWGIVASPGQEFDPVAIYYETEEIL